VTRQLRSHFRFFARNDEVIFSALNLLVFVFVVTAFVFVLQQETNDSINNYIDALYFTVVTLTTIGYGDLHPTTDLSKIFTIFFVFAGVSFILGFLNFIVSRTVRERVERKRGGG